MNPNTAVTELVRTFETIEKEHPDTLREYCSNIAPTIRKVQELVASGGSRHTIRGLLNLITLEASICDKAKPEADFKQLQSLAHRISDMIGHFPM
jgi:hypothetical protein